MSFQDSITTLLKVQSTQTFDGTASIQQFLGAIVTLNGIHADMLEENQTLNAEVERLVDENKQLTDRCDKDEREIYDSNVAYDENQALRFENEKLQMENQSMSELIDKLTNGKQDKQQQNDKLKSECEQAKSELKSLTDNYIHDISGLKKELDELNKSREHCGQTVVDLENHVNELTNERQTLTKTIQQDNETISGLYDRVNHAHSEIRQSERDISDLKKDLNKLREHYEAVSVNNVMLTRKNQDLDAACQRDTKINAELNKQLLSRSQKIKSMETMLDDAADEITKLKLEVTKAHVLRRESMY